MCYVCNTCSPAATSHMPNMCPESKTTWVEFIINWALQAWGCESHVFANGLCTMDEHNHGLTHWCRPASLSDIKAVHVRMPQKVRKSACNSYFAQDQQTAAWSLEDCGLRTVGVILSYSHPRVSGAKCSWNTYATIQKAACLLDQHGCSAQCCTHGRGHDGVMNCLRSRSAFSSSRACWHITVCWHLLHCNPIHRLYFPAFLALVEIIKLRSS